MGPQSSFAQQFFAVSPIISQSRVVLAGGLYPLQGSRSAYRASLACYDYAAGSIVWLNDKTRSYPFRAIAHSSGICAVLLDQNFVRCPKGMFRFDLESGEPLEPACEVAGWKIDCLDATPETFLFSWVDQETSRMRIVGARDATFKERSFPYHSMPGGKTIERVIASGQETFVAIFSLIQGNRVVYSIEQWSLVSASPSWEKRTTFKWAVRNDSHLLLWGHTNTELDVAIHSIESGNVETSFRITLADVMSIQPISGDTYAVLSLSGVFVMDAASQTVRPVPGIGPSDMLDFGALAVDSASEKLIVITAGNHQRPGTYLTVLDL